MKKDLKNMDYQSNSKKFQTVVCGGTFDHFHKGHESFLKHALFISGKIIVGITSDRYVENSKVPLRREASKIQKSKSFENFISRKKSVEKFLKDQKKIEYEIIKIEDMFGTTLNQDFFADAILVSENTKESAEKINEERVKRGLSQFKVIVTPQVLGEDKKLISSFRIRKGEIDRKGRLYVRPIWLKKTFFLPQELRHEFKKPFAELITRINKNKLQKLQKNSYLMAVGDETTRTFNSLGVKPSVSIIDFKVARQKKFSDLKELGFSGEEEIIHVKNPASTITSELFSAIARIIQKLNENDQIIVQIDGEDDLSVMPLILAAPLKSYIFYGQPSEGIVSIDIDEKIKNKARSLMARLITRGY